MTLQDLELISESAGNYWDGRGSIILMRDKKYNQWKQMEWAGFYFQFLIQNYNDDRFLIPGKTINKTVFDAHLISDDLPLDVKFHSNKNPKGVHNKTVILNDLESTLQAINLYGKVGVVIACGDCKFDDTGEFKLWHDEYKGEKSAYCKKAELENKISRQRKTSINLTQINYYEINNNNINLLGEFQQGMKNSNDTLRNAKLSLNMSKISPIYTITK